MSDKDEKKPRTLPQVPPADRERLNEGVDNPKPTMKPNVENDKPKK